MNYSMIMGEALRPTPTLCRKSIDWRRILDARHLPSCFCMQAVEYQSINQACSWWRALYVFKETNRWRGRRLWLRII